MVINYHDGGGNDPYRPDFTRVSVEPADLAEFADMLDSDIQALRETWDRLRADIGAPSELPSSGEPAGINPNFPGAVPAEGSPGITEANEFSRAYYQTLHAEFALMRDLIRGMEILRDAARSVHDGYLRTDAANAGGIERAFEAYEPWQVIEAFRNLTDASDRGPLP